MFFVERAAHFLKELQLMRESRIRSDASKLINRLKSFLKTQSFLERRGEGEEEGEGGYSMSPTLS